MEKLQGSRSLAGDKESMDSLPVERSDDSTASHAGNGKVMNIILTEQPDDSTDEDSSQGSETSTSSDERILAVVESKRKNVVMKDMWECIRKLSKKKRKNKILRRAWQQKVESIRKEGTETDVLLGVQDQELDTERSEETKELNNKVKAI
ncbi:unnamed protein product [Larinioides sclopetarius]|uniref:Uncharacterized protein n=1 Tax=Larinioides sclopetarius TaxID=280406 RepID=A0AAV2B1N1_9ARAC